MTVVRRRLPKSSADGDDSDSGRVVTTISIPSPVSPWFPRCLLSCSWFAMFTLLFLFRLGNAWMVRTYFNPDEYWQSSEVAHEMAFGYGHRTWEWREGARLRGASHPAVFALLYRLVVWLGLDEDGSIIIRVAPRVLQAVLAAVCDVYVYRLAGRMFNLAVARWTLLLHLTNWFTFYCLIRTYSNSMETVFTTIALYYWPLPGVSASTPCPFPRDGSGLSSFTLRQSRILSLIFAAVACVLRPTSATFWLPLTLLHALHLMTDPPRELLVSVAASAPVSASVFNDTTCHYSPWRHLWHLMVDCISVGTVAIVLSTVGDTWFYTGIRMWQQWSWQWLWQNRQSIVIVPWNFVKFNAAAGGGSSIYGVNSHLYFFIEAIPVMLCSYLPLALVGVFVALGLINVQSFVSKSTSSAAGASSLASSYMASVHIMCVVITVLVAYSFTPHKEYRFILPVLPVLLIFAGVGCQTLLTTATCNAGGGRRKKQRQWWRASSVHVAHRCIAIAITVNLIALLYFSLRHQRAPIAVMQFLGHESATTTVTGVLMLMGCHSTPHQSQFHFRRIPLWFLDCSPQLHQQKRDATLSPATSAWTLQHSASEHFRHDPLKFISDLVYHQQHSQSQQQQQQSVISFPVSRGTDSETDVNDPCRSFDSNKRGCFNASFPPSSDSRHHLHVVCGWLECPNNRHMCVQLSLPSNVTRRQCGYSSDDSSHDNRVGVSVQMPLVVQLQWQYHDRMLIDDEHIVEAMIDNRGTLLMDKATSSASSLSSSISSHSAEFRQVCRACPWEMRSRGPTTRQGVSDKDWGTPFSFPLGSFHGGEHLSQHRDHRHDETHAISTATPSHLVLWENQAGVLLPFLWSHGYRLRRRLFHSDFGDEGTWMDVYECRYANQTSR